MQVFLDSNVFLYAIGKPHPMKEPCAAVLRAVARGDLDANTSTEVAQEVMYVLGRRGHRALAATVVGNLVGLFPAMLAVELDDITRASTIYVQNPGIPTRDAVHAATMLNAGISTVVSADRDFEQISGIKRVDPTAI